jgi:hypothetical protein
MITTLLSLQVEPGRLFAEAEAIWRSSGTAGAGKVLGRVWLVLAECDRCRVIKVMKGV